MLARFFFFASMICSFLLSLLLEPPFFSFCDLVCKSHTWYLEHIQREHGYIKSPPPPKDRYNHHFDSRFSFSLYVFLFCMLAVRF